MFAAENFDELLDEFVGDDSPADEVVVLSVLTNTSSTTTCILSYND